MRCVVSYENHCIVSDFYVYAMIIIEDIIVTVKWKKEIEHYRKPNWQPRMGYSYTFDNSLYFKLIAYVFRVHLHLIVFFVTIISVRYAVLLELLFWFCLNCCRINLRTKVS